MPYVVVTTSTRDIWYGKVKKIPTEPGCVKLSKARNILYYSAGEGDEKGLGSLATSGPQSGSKIGPPVRLTTLSNFVACMECSAEAVERFASQGWGQ